jgi:hypothetical protein
MLASSIPVKYPIPFGNNAVPTNINQIPQASQIGITAGAASLVDGFPPVTFIPVGAGGIPPWGRDFTGLFNRITAWTQFADCAGALPLFDAVFSSAIGGYPQGALIAAINGVTTGSPQGGEHLWLSTIDNNTLNPDTVFSPANWIPVPAIIDGPVSYTVGSGMQFADLSLAMEYLSKFTITHNGSAAINYSSGVYSYTQNVNLTHPNGDRITINGMPTLLGGIVSGTFSVTGSSSSARAIDRTATLANLRAIYPTELDFIGGTGMYILSNGITINNLLINGDRTGNPNLSLLSIQSSVVTLGNVSVINGGGFAIGGQSGHVSLTGPISGSGSISGGITFADCGSLLYGNTASSIYGTANDYSGLRAQGGSILRANGIGKAHAWGNGAFGVLADENGCVECGPGSSVSSNGGPGILAYNGRILYNNSTLGFNLTYGAQSQDGGFIQCLSSTFTGNGSGATLAELGSAIDATGSSGVAGASSPAVNVVGNGNSIVLG